jgi:NCS1 family nucleobase:cation symporter-1
MSESRESSIQREVYFGILPVLRGERPFGLWDFLLVQIGFGIAAWSFLVGGYTGFVLPAGSAVAAILFGNAIPVFLISVLAILYNRYGVDTFIGARAILGPRGSNLFLLIFAILNLGWITIACFMLGESAIRVTAAFNGP